MNIEKENNLFNDNIVYDLTKFTHLDYPDKLSCIVWFIGCNMRCPYCYNKDIVFSKEGKYSLNDILDFLKTRVGLLDAVVLSGGEATGHSLTEFCKKIKDIGFLIKLDTNGTNFAALKELIDLKLVDFISLDYKAPEYKFKQLTMSNKFAEFSKSLDFLINSERDFADESFGFEIRTTVHSDLLDEDDINYIMVDLKKRGYSKKYYLQNFLYTSDNIGNIPEQKKVFDKSRLLNDLDTVWRN